MEWWNDLGWWIDVSEVARNFGIVAAGATGLLIAWLRVRAANRQARASIDQSETARRAHVAEIFKDAVGLLGGDRLEIRLGAILTLRQIADGFAEYRGYVIEVLSAYLRNRALEPSEGEAVPPDIKAIMAMLEERLSED